MTMRLDTLNDHPEIIVTIGGREYSFSRLTIGLKAKLQAYLRRTVPHPIDAIKPYLDGLEAEDRAALLEGARQDAKRWPPDIGTPAGMIALTQADDGTIELLALALSMHHPEMTRSDAERLKNDLERESEREAMAARRRGQKYDGKGLAWRIISIIMGKGDPTVEDELPEGSGPDRPQTSIGASSTDSASNGSK